MLISIALMPVYCSSVPWRGAQRRVFVLLFRLPLKLSKCLFFHFHFQRCYRISIIKFNKSYPLRDYSYGGVVLMEEMESLSLKAVKACEWPLSWGMHCTLGLPGKIKFTGSQFTLALYVISQWWGLSVNSLTAACAVKCAEISGRQSPSRDSL